MGKYIDLEASVTITVDSLFGEKDIKPEQTDPEGADADEH